jgi:light-regulated signal transduction histidine kinase (bacteriophytochrome)
MLERKVESSLDHDGRHYMESIASAASKMRVLIDNLLSFSRKGRQEMSLAPVALEPLVREIIEELAQDAAGRDITWTLGELPTVHGDVALLKIALANLISNALKFTRPQRQVRIDIGSSPAEDSPSDAVIFVRDNGVGFDMAYLNKLFGVFQRLHGNNEFEGNGIGLATVRRIIGRHGGRTWAEGKPGQGATMYFTLRRAP